MSMGVPAGDSVTGAVRTLLRVEGLTVLVLSVGAYAQWSGQSWGLFAALFLLPDLSMLGYLRGPRVGAGVYNLVHTYVGPALLGSAGLFWLGSLWLGVALIWAAHIGADRLIGYGLKLPANFQSTHLGVIGRAKETI